MKLTVEAAKALEPGGVLRCHVVKGLELHRTVTGHSWKVYYRGPDGSKRRPKIGAWPAVTIEAAREAAKETLRRVAKGEDPSAERQALRRAPTVEDLFAEYEKTVIVPQYKKNTAVTARSVWRVYVLPALGKERVADVTVADVNKLLAKVAKHSPAAAANVRAYLSKAMQLAESHALQWRPKLSNPCRDAECLKYGTRKRRRHVRPDEFQAIHRELQNLSAAYPWNVAAIYVILYAGARVTEVASAKWSDVVTDEFGTRIVRTEHKTDRHRDERNIRLPAQAVRLLAALPKHKNGYLFGPLGELEEPRRSIWETWNDARTAARLHDLQPRDLRRTFASAAKSRGVKLDAIGDIFDHGSTSTTLRYAFLFDDTAAETVQTVGDAIEGLLLEGPKK